MTENEAQKPTEKVRLFVWFLIGCIPVLILALIFLRPIRCLLEYRINEAHVGLVALLVTALAAILARFVWPEAPKTAWSAGGGIVVAFLVLLLVYLALPPIPQAECPWPTPTPTPTLTATPTPTVTPTPTIPPSPTPCVWRCPENTDGAKYVASDESDKFHCLDCEWAEKISPGNRLCFCSYEAAIGIGLQPCKVCDPP